MDWSRYDQQEDREPLDAIREAKASVGRADIERYEQERRVQAYLHQIKENASSVQSHPEGLRSFTNQGPAPDSGYCRDRLGGRVSRLLRWHYYMALHFAERGGDRLARAIPLVLESAERAGGSLRPSSYLLLAHNMNRWHNCKMDDAVLKSALRHIRGRRGDVHAHWCAKIVEDLEERSEVRDEVRDLLMGVAGDVKPEMAPQYLERAASVAHDKAPATKAWAEFHEKYADKSGSPELQIAYYNDAKRYLEGRGDLRRINEKIKRAEESVRLNEHRQTYEVTVRGISGRSGVERVAHLVEELRGAIRSVEAARYMAGEMSGKRPGGQPFARVIIGDDGVPGPRPGAPREERADRAGQVARRIQMLEALFSANARECEEDGRITAGSYMEYLDEAGLHDGAARELV